MLIVFGKLVKTDILINLDINTCVHRHVVCRSTCCISVDMLYVSQRVLLTGYCYKLWFCCILVLVLTQVCRFDM